MRTLHVSELQEYRSVPGGRPGAESAHHGDYSARCQWHPGSSCRHRGPVVITFLVAGTAILLVACLGFSISPMPEPSRSQARKQDLAEKFWIRFGFVNPPVSIGTKDEEDHHGPVQISLREKREPADTTEQDGGEAKQEHLERIAERSSKPQARQQGTLVAEGTDMGAGAPSSAEPSAHVVDRGTIQEPPAGDDGTIQEPPAGSVAGGQWANGQSLDQNQALATATPPKQAEQQLQQQAAATQAEAEEAAAAQKAEVQMEAERKRAEEEAEEMEEQEEEVERQKKEEKQKEAEAAAAAAAAAKRAKELEEEEAAKKLQEKIAKELKEKELAREKKRIQEEKEKERVLEKQRIQEELEKAQKAMDNLLQVVENVGWEVQTSHFINVRSAMELTAPLLGKKHACEVLDAHQNGDWIKLTNEAGYVKMTFDTDKLLRNVGFSFARLSNITCFDVGQIPVVLAATCSRAAAALQLPSTVAQTVGGEDGIPEGCYLLDDSRLVLVSKSVEQGPSVKALARRWEPVCYTSPTRCSLGMPETPGELTTVTQTTTTTTAASAFN